MGNYVYSDWNSETYGTSVKLSRLRSHIAEVSDEITAKVSSQGESFDPSNLNSYLDLLFKQESRLKQQVASEDLSGNPRLVTQRSMSFGGR
jgi:hypothetical protein